MAIPKLPALGMQEQGNEQDPDDPFADMARKRDTTSDPFADLARPSRDTGDVDLRDPESEPIRLAPVVVKPSKVQQKAEAEAARMRERTGRPAASVGMDEDGGVVTVGQPKSVGTPKSELDRLVNAPDLATRINARMALLKQPAGYETQGRVSPADQLAAMVEQIPKDVARALGTTAASGFSAFGDTGGEQFSPTTDKEDRDALLQTLALAAAPAIGELSGKATANVAGKVLSNVGKARYVEGAAPLSAVEQAIVDNAPQIARGIGGTVGAGTEGAAVGAAFDPEHRGRGATIGALLGVAGNDLARAGTPTVRRVTEPVAETNPARILPSRTRVSAQVADEAAAPMSSDYAVETTPQHEALQSRLDQIRAAAQRPAPVPEPVVEPVGVPPKVSPEPVPPGVTPPEHVAVRVGPITPEGAFFERTSGKPVGDATPYDLRNTNLLDGTNTAQVQQLMQTIAQDPSLTPQQKAQVDGVAQLGVIDQATTETLPVAQVAKQMGYDGVQVAPTDPSEPPSVMVWNLRTVQPASVQPVEPVAAQETAPETTDKIAPKTTHDVHVPEPFDTPEIRALDEQSQAMPSTRQIETPERQEFRREQIERMAQFRTPGKVAHIVLGLPGSGKSSQLAVPLAESSGGALLDSDRAKQAAPEYAGGLGVNALHAESTDIRGAALKQVLSQGGNLVFSTVGDPKGTVALAKALVNAGYQVHVHLADVPPDVSAQRMLDGFRAGTRHFVSPRAIFGAGANPRRAFHALSQLDGVTVHDPLDNTGPRGSAPQPVPDWRQRWGFEPAGPDESLGGPAGVRPDDGPDGGLPRRPRGRGPEPSAGPAPRPAGDRGPDEVGPLESQKVHEDGVQRFRTARTPSGVRRAVHRVSTQGLLDELLDLEAKRADAESRAPYELREDEHFATSGIPQIVSTKDRIGGGPSRQAKAARNLADFSRITDEIFGELATRMPTEDIWQAVEDTRAARDERAALEGDYAAVQRGREITDENGNVLFEPRPEYHDGPDLFGNVEDSPTDQGSLFGETAGTEGARSLAETERAARAEIQQLRQRLSVAAPESKPAIAARIAQLEKLVNRGEKITADELRTEAQGETEPPDSEQGQLLEPGAVYPERSQTALFDNPTSPAAQKADVENVTQSFGSPLKAGLAAKSLAREAPAVVQIRAKGLPVSPDRIQKIKTADTRAWVDIRGQRINTPAKAAQLLHAFRNPRMERMHVVLMDNAGTILSHSMVSSGAIGVVQFGPDFIPRVIARAKRLGATRAIISHNHPSGDPTPSPDDRAYTLRMGSELQAAGIHLDGHLVIDHHTAAWIGPMLDTSDGVYRMGQVGLGIPEPSGVDWTEYGTPGRRMHSHGQMARMIADVVTDESFAVMYLDVQHQVVAVEPHTLSAIETMPTWIEAHRKANAAAVAVIAARSDVADRIAMSVAGDVGTPTNQPWARNVLDVLALPSDDRTRYFSYAVAGTVRGADKPVKARHARSVFEEGPTYEVRGTDADDTAAEGPGAVPLSGTASTDAQPRGRGTGGRDAGRVPETDRVRRTPEIDRAFATVGADIDFTGELAKAAKKANPRSVGMRLSRFADQIANANGPIERLGQAAGSRPNRNPQDLLTYVKASDHTVSLALHEAVLDPVTREPMGPSFDSIFAPLKGNDADLIRALTYLKAKRDVGRGIESVRGNIQKWEAAQRVVAFGDQDPVLSAFAQRWSDYTDAIGQYAVKSGLWTEDLWDRMKASDVLYVRYKRILQQAVQHRGSKSGAVKTLGNVTPGVDRFIGSERAVENIAVALAEYTKQIIHRADRYRVGAAVFDAVDDMGPAGEVIGRRIASDDPKARALSAQHGKQVPLAEDDVLTELKDLFDPRLDARNPVLWRNGPQGREYMQIDSPELWSAIMQLHASDEGAVRAFLDVTVRPIKRIFTASTTGWSPRFSLATNPARDIPTALAQSQAKVTAADIARGFAEAAKALAGKSDLAEEAGRSGLSGVSLFEQDRPKFAARRAAPLSKADRRRNAVGKVVSAPVAALEAAGKTTDLGPRLGEYMAAMRQFLPKVQSGEWTPAEARLRAARLGRGVTLDFSNRPANPVLKMFADYIPFFGVSIQGPTVAAQSAKRNPKRFGAVYAAAAMAAVVAWVLKHQLLTDEEREEFNDRLATERSGFLYVPTGHGGPTLRVPLGQEMGIVVQGVTAGLDKFYDDDPAAGALVVASLARALPAGMDAMATGVIPLPGIQQVQENAANRKVFGGRPVEPRRMEDVSPAERRYDTTPPTFDMLAAGARKVGFSEMSPLKAENLMRGVTSSATPLITSLTDPIATRVMGREAQPSVPRRLRENPLSPTSPFVASKVASSTESERRFYDLKDKVTQAENDLRSAKKAGDTKAVRRILRDKADLLDKGLGDRIDDVDTAMKAIRDAEQGLREQYQSGDMTADETRDRLDELALERHRIVRAALKGERMSRIDRLRYERAVSRAEKAARRMLRRRVP